MGEDKPKKLSRRQFLKESAITGAALSLSSFWGVTSRGKKRKVVKVGTRAPSKIVPGLLNDAAGQTIGQTFGDYLFRLQGEEQKRGPSLVEHYDSSTDKKEWTFKVREGVKFHHGTELTSKDVIYTFNRILDPDLGSPAKSVFSNVDDIKKVDKYTSQFVLKKPDPDFQLKFYNYNTTLVAHDYDYTKKKPSGTGAFKIKERHPGEKIILERHPDYFIPGLPKVDELHFVIVPEVSTQVLRLKSGDLQVAGPLGITQFKELERNKKTNALVTPGAFHAPISMRTDQPPFNDNRVRRAMKYCVDRERMVEAITAGTGDMGHDHPVWEGYQWYKDLGTRTRDIAKAKELLAQAGHEDGLDVSLYYQSDRTDSMDTALNFQQMAKPAGINVKLVGSTSDVYYSKYWLKVNLMCTHWAHRVDIRNLLNLAYKSGASWNEGHYSNKELDRHIEAASYSIKPEERQKHFTEIQKIIRQEGHVIIPSFQGLYGGSTKKVEDVWIMRSGGLELRHINYV